MLLNHLMVAMYSSDIVSIEEGENRVTFKFLATMVNLFKNMPGRVKLAITYEPKEENLHKLLKISNLHLSDPCFDETLCSRNGDCLTITANEYQCACEEKFTGHYYLNLINSI